MEFPLVVRVMLGFKADLLAMEVLQVAEMTRRWLEMERFLSLEFESLAAEIARLRAAGEDVPRSKIVRMNRYQAFLAQVTGQLSQYTDYASGLITREQANWLVLGIQHAIDAIKAYFVTGGSVAGAFDILPVSAIQNMVGLAGDGSPLRTLLTESWPTAVDGLTNALVESTALGISPRETARRMANKFGVGLDRAINIARTEQLRVYREANLQQYRESGMVSGYQRLSARDARVCPACLFADDGTIYPLDTSFEEHPQGRCLVPGTQVLSSHPEAFISRRYHGEIINIRTAAGKFLAVTPNHPILTSRGWLPANLLQKGDHVVGYSGSDWSAAGDPNKNHVPTLVENIPTAFRMNRLAVMPASPKDFHGDGKGSDVYIVWSNSLLWNNFNISFLKKTVQENFGARDGVRFPLARDSQIASMTPGLFSSASNILRDFNSTKMFGAWGGIREDSIGFSLIAQSDPGHLQPYTNGSSTYPKRIGNHILGLPGLISPNNFSNGEVVLRQLSGRGFLPNNFITSRFVPEQIFSLEKIRHSLTSDMKASGNFFNTFTGNISLDCIIEIGVTSFSGHVYNLQTSEGWYISNGIITHNCTPVPVVIGMPLVTWQNGISWFEAQNAEAQRSILGSGRYDAWQDGDFELADVVRRVENDVWGASLVPASLSSLIGNE